jgi:argininosuccinate lyase
MLSKQGILAKADEEAILGGLDEVESEIKSETFPYRDELEDIHMNIEARLQELIGEPGRRVHTARSRNDQVSLDLKLFCLDVASEWIGLLTAAIGILVGRADEYKKELYPAWTHMQAAQPLSWGHYLLSFVEMLGRDHDRLESYLERHSVNPLGAGALSGTSLPINPDQSARDLGFSESFRNSYDVAGDRDAVLELVQISTQVMLHLSRMAEDFIYFNSTPVQWIELPDSLCTGSSMMPQKKNPDVLELVRGKSASVIGHANALAVLLKGLPTSYQRDLQQDKVHLFDTVDLVTDSLEVLEVLLEGFSLRTDRSHAALRQGFLMATELAEYLVRNGVPFRSAHAKVGRLVAFCIEQRKAMEELSAEELVSVIPECGPGALAALEPNQVLKTRTHRGSTGLSSIEAQISHWREWVTDHRRTGYRRTD